ncbi:Uncharacterised protein [Mycobacterium tuberculosis]|nr:Uncharacterised protein [Mycobacterium tuberculosis]CKP64083.1 Uncharacterised protein [Mycobacterium tuberculosis]CKU53230.1 Uncharacterised protein [Mycobacterium tuberculosis]CNM47076.1 Uncharacterised protein [Mycobacterium tuberculosis]CNT83606.1 Uncharacterised protein [Mycobacterium tuberculosis]
MATTDRRRPIGRVGVQPVAVAQHLRDRVGRRSHQRDMPTPGSQRDRNVLGIHRRRAQQEHRRRRRLLDNLEQRVGGAFGQPIGVLNHHDLPVPGSRPARGDLHDGPHFVHTDRQTFGNHPAYVGVGARQRGRTRPAAPAPGLPARRTLQSRREAQRGNRAPRTGRTGEQPRVCHSPAATRAVSRITTGRLGRGKQLGFHRLLAYQPRKHPGHHRQQ